MRHTALTLLACVVLIVLTVAMPVRGQDVLGPPQKLYLEAQYDEALKLIDEAKAGTTLAGETALSVERLRALCLLALDRKADAQQAVEAILDIDPLYRMSEDDASPKMRTAFQDLVRRALPAVLERVYSRARQAYGRKSYTEAVSGFTLVRALLDDADLTLSAEARADMALVARGFLDLARAASAPPPPSAVQPSAPAVLSRAPAVPSPAPVVPATDGSLTPPGADQVAQTSRASLLYDAGSTGVTPPSPIRTGIQIPQSMLPSGSAWESMVEVVVATNGSVESATVRQPTGGSFVALVVQSARVWRYRPATKDGTPVRYRLLVKVVIPPRG